MAVTRCVCYRTPFAKLVPRIKAEGWTSVDEIMAATGCGTGCSGCRPYLVEVLATGATAFRVRQGESRPVPCSPDPWDPDQ